MFRARCIPGKDGFSTLVLSPRLALMYRALKKPGKGGRRDRIQCAYFGFSTQEQAQHFTAYVQEQFKARAMPRESDRLSECAWEVKVWEFDGLLDFALRCYARSQQQAA
jgi:hypothetical protein